MSDKKTKQAEDTRTATIKALATPVTVPGLTMAKGATAKGVPLAHAEYLESKGTAEIIEVTK